MALDNRSPEYRAFLEAVTNGRTAEVEQQLTEHPEFLDLPNSSGYRPLDLAAQNGHDSIVKLLLNRGSTALDCPNKYGMTPLHYAAKYGHDSMGNLLLSFLRYEPPFGPHYIRHCVRQHGSTLLRSPVCIDSANNYGWTPLHHAAWYGHDSTVVLLLQHGSTSLDSPDNTGRTPLHLAADGHDSTATILKAAGGTTLSLDNLNQQQIAKLQAPIPEDEILEIRYRIYFSRPLLSTFL